MKKDRCKWLGLVVLSLATLLVMGGCGGSSSSNNNDKTVTKATISGSVSFPSMTNLVAKRVGSVATDLSVTVKAYTIDGTEAGSAIPSYDNSAATRVYSYSIANLNPGVDYVIKVTKSGAVLKKLIEKKNVTAGSVIGQNINSVSTAAVIVASKKLDMVLGDPIPAGKTMTVTTLSAAISTDIKPQLLEGDIDAAVSGGVSAVTDSNKAAFANVFNIVVTAGVQGIDPAAMFTAAPPVLTNTVPILTVATGTTVATVTQTTVNASVVTTNAAPTYTPPAETAAMYNARAKQYLAAQDISNAALNYEKAIASIVVATDTPEIIAEANFGGAITSGMMLMEDPDVQSIITKWGAVVPTVNQVVQGTSPIKLPFGNMTSFSLSGGSSSPSPAKVTSKSAATATAAQNVLTAFSALRAKLPQQKTGFKSLAKELGLVATTAPTISEMQTLIDNVIIPRIDKIIARLAKAETTTAFSFTITAAMQGNVNGTDETLNAGELYTLDAALNIFQVLFKIASSYNFDIPSPYTYNTIGQDPLAMINSPSFFTLKSGGAAKMAGALDNAKAAAIKAKLAYDTVEKRLPGVGMIDLTGWSQLEKDDFVKDHVKVTAALAGQYDVLDKLGAKIVTINATRFFTTPLTKLNLPTFGYDVPRNIALSTKYDSAVAGEQTVTNQYWNGTGYSTSSYLRDIECKIVPTSDLPDYTLNGILPNNTPATKIGDFTGILPKLEGKLLAEKDTKLLYGANSRVYVGATEFYFGYNTPGTTTVAADRAVYKLDPTMGTVTPYCTDVIGIPTGMNYKGITYYANPSGLYAQLVNASGSYEYRAISLNGTSCSIATTATKTVTVPVGMTGFTFENISANVDPLLHYYLFTPSSVTPPYAASYTYYSAGNSTAALLTLTQSYSGKSLMGIRNGTIAVKNNYENVLEQYTIGADGITVTPSGTFTNIDYRPNYGEKKLLLTGGGYYWLFDGLKMIKYAGKPNGTNF